MTVNVKNGDRVRIILEGEAWNAETWLGSKSVSIGRNGDGSNTIKLNAEHVVSVEVLAKQFKVGDTVSGDDYAKLPVGAVVNGYGETMLKLDNGRFLSTARNDYAAGAFADPRVLVFLPDAS